MSLEDRVRALEVIVAELKEAKDGPERCSVCGTTRDVGTRDLVDGKWVSWCDTCYPEPDPTE